MFRGVHFRETRLGAYYLRLYRKHLDQLILFEFQIADGKVVVDVLKAIGEQKYAGNDKAIGTFKEISDECAGVSGSDHCELSANLIECMNNAAIARGVDLNKGIQA